eukprot:14399297-Alexandrium_andersonii.AAC.1
MFCLSPSLGGRGPSSPDGPNCPLDSSESAKHRSRAFQKRSLAGRICRMRSSDVRQIPSCGEG